MPYVDQGEPQPVKMPPILPIIVVLLVAGLTPVLWYGCHLWFGYSYAGAPLGGLAVGLAAKFTLNRPVPPLRVVAILLIVLGSAAGYIWVDSTIWTPFMFDKSIERFFRDIMALLFTGVGCYIAFALAAPRLAVKPYAQDQQPQ